MALPISFFEVSGLATVFLSAVYSAYYFRHLNIAFRYLALSNVLAFLVQSIAFLLTFLVQNTAPIYNIYILGTFVLVKSFFYCSLKKKTIYKHLMAWSAGLVFIFCSTIALPTASMILYLLMLWWCLHICGYNRWCIRCC